jgi:glycosyltransferase involved in cell wall biosynthesis
VRALHLSTWREKCGVAGYTEDLVNALNEQGVVNDVFPLRASGRALRLFAEVRAELDRFCLRAQDYDLVHVQHEFSFFTDTTDFRRRSIEHFRHLLRRLRRVGKPVVVTFHTEPDFLIPFKDVLKAKPSPLSALTTYLSGRAWVRGVMRPFFSGRAPFDAIVHTHKARVGFANAGADPARIHTIPIGIAPRAEQFRALGREAAQRELGYPPDTVLLSVFGFVTKYKGLLVAVMALRALPPNYHLAIVGGPHPQDCADFTLDQVLGMVANCPELKGRVRVTGYAPPALIDLYHAATHVCLAPYLNYSLSASAGLTWALSSGRPVVASKIPPFIELNDEANCLVLFTENAAFELAWQIQRLLASPELQDALVARADDYVARHSWAQTARSVLALYRQLAQGRPAAAVPAGPGPAGAAA